MGLSVILRTKWNLSLLPGNVPLLDKNRQVFVCVCVCVPFLHLTSICKWKNGTKTKWNEKPLTTNKNLNKPSSLVTGLYISKEPSTQPSRNATPWRVVGSRPTTQETAGNGINTTARVTLHGAQGPKITLPSPLVEILTGILATHRYHEISSSSQSWINSCYQITYPKYTPEDFL